MANIDTAYQLYKDTLSSLGESALSAIFPRDFEVYLCALELVDYSGVTIDFFVFPVMPNSIQKVEKERVSVTKTLTGTVVMQSSSYVPDSLVINGNFGRSFKYVSNNKSLVEGDSSFSNGFFKALSIKRGVYSADNVDSNIPRKIYSEFNPSVKTGFGCVKILQSIISKSKASDEGKPFRMHFYNLALNESYLVVAGKTPLTLSQNIQDSNMLWNYTLNLEVLGDLQQLVFSSENANKQSLTLAMASNNINKLVRDTFNSVKYVTRK